MQFSAWFKQHEQLVHPWSIQRWNRAETFDMTHDYYDCSERKYFFILRFERHHNGHTILIESIHILELSNWFPCCVWHRCLLLLKKKNEPIDPFVFARLQTEKKTKCKAKILTSCRRTCLTALLLYYSCWFMRYWLTITWNLT